MIPLMFGRAPPKYCFKENYGKIFSKEIHRWPHKRENVKVPSQILGFEPAAATESADIAFYLLLLEYVYYQLILSYDDSE